MNSFGHLRDFFEVNFQSLKITPFPVFSEQWLPWTLLEHFCSVDIALN